MFNTSLAPYEHLPLVALALAACVSTDPGVTGAPPPLVRRFEPSPPAWASAGALSVVVVLYDPSGPTLASGTVVGPDLILTAQHVAAGLETDEAGWNTLEVEGVRTRVRVEAHGDAERPHGDWAVLRLERPRFERFARIHAASLDPAWSPSPGTEIALAGFALGFYPEPKIDLDDPTPAITVKACESPVDAPPASRHEEGAQTPDDDRTPRRDRDELSWCATGPRLDLGGMSGGAALVRGAGTGEPELIGVFSSLVLTTTEETDTTEFLGIAIRTRQRRIPSIVYSIHRVPAGLPAFLDTSRAR